MSAVHVSRKYTAFLVTDGPFNQSGGTKTGLIVKDRVSGKTIGEQELGQPRRHMTIIPFAGDSFLLADGTSHFFMFKVS